MTPQSTTSLNHVGCASAKINISYSILFNLTTSYSSYFKGKKGISRNKTSFFLLMCLRPAPFVRLFWKGQNGQQVMLSTWRQAHAPISWSSSSPLLQSVPIRPLVQIAWLSVHIAKSWSWVEWFGLTISDHTCFANILESPWKTIAIYWCWQSSRRMGWGMFWNITSSSQKCAGSHSVHPLWSQRCIACILY